ncbi:MAG TPA: hypothetical protein VFO29_11830 [Candidatus Rubrimentiphilum sp.]|nr:hypothetical protein [Candidatus Rubrimentiphilum sp.]
MGRPISSRVALAFTIASTLLSACGGGGGGNPILPIIPTNPPVTTSSVSGTVVDETTNAPLAGIQIAIAPFTVGATPSPVATTAANGTFSFTTTPGHYLLVVGSNSPSDTRTTLHVGEQLAAGANALTLPTPTAPPNVTLTAAQTSGNFRLQTLSANQQNCVTAANQGRANLPLPLLVPDEFLSEDAGAIVQEAVAQSTDTPSPLFGFTQPFGPTGASGNVTGLTTSTNFSSCGAWTGPSYSYVNGNPPFPYATSAANIWYGADWSSATGHYGAQLWLSDIR